VDHLRASDQLQLWQDPTTKHLKTLDSLLCYVQHLSDSFSRTSVLCDYDSKRLLNAHFDKSSLFIDKYIQSAIPDVQLEFLFESQGIMEYSAWLDSDKKYKHVVCDSEDHFSELFIPNIRGDHFNPYIRFKSSSVCGSQQASKLMDLAGLGPKVDTDDLSGMHDTVFNLMVLTFPKEIGYLLLDPVIRDITISRMQSCFKEFFRSLKDVFYLDSDSILGCSCSLHLWSSEFPFIPHPHFHVVLPHFCYNSVTKPDRMLYDEWLEESFYCKIRDCIDTVDLGTIRKTTRSAAAGSLGATCKVIEEVPVQHRFIVDPELYEHLKQGLSNQLAEYLFFQPLHWQGLTDKGRSVPIPVDSIKKLWSSIVSKEFGEISIESLDIHVKFCKHSEKSKLLHYLQYKTRPAVLDLDIFFKKCENFVTDYNSLDPNAAIGFIRSLFVKAVMNEDLFAAKYDSLLSSAEELFHLYTPQDILDWLKFLAIAKTDTRVYGFWRNIKRYLLNPLEQAPVLIVLSICPICDGVKSDIRYIDSPMFDSVIIRHRSRFLVYDIKDPPGVY